MRFATLPAPGRDGQLYLVDGQGQRCVSTAAIVGTLQELIERWTQLLPDLQDMAARLEQGLHPQAQPFVAGQCLAPLPRAWQWCDASAFLNHVDLLTRAYGMPMIESARQIPLMYQGAGDDLLGAQADVPLPDEAHGIDVEGEFGVLIRAVPMGISASQALEHIVLAVQLNDWSLRTLGAQESGTGMGFVRGKPSTAFAPLAVTLDELGESWRDGRIHLDLHVDIDDLHLGQPNGGEMHFDFGQLIAHAASTRRLCDGTLIGSGTVSNRARTAGSSCLAERRMIEILEHGAARTPFMSFGQRVRMLARHPDGRPGPFGAIDQRVVRN
jgi:fumarylacetoacetate (FAA) hydrolase